MNVRLLAALLTLLVTSCGKKDRETSSAPPSNKTAEETPAAAEPVAAAEAPPCDEAAIDEQIDGMHRAMSDYLSRVLDAFGSETECEPLRQRLLQLQPHAQAFENSMRSAMAFKASVSEECAPVLKQRGDELEARLKKELPELEAMDATMRGALERCRSHPGMQEAAQGGLRLMKRK